MSKEIELIFSYGTLQDEEVQLAVFQRSLKGEKDRLLDYQLQSAQVYGRYPVVRPVSHCIATGMCYELKPEELALADAYEGPGYRRKLLPLESGRKAWVYLENQNH